MPPSKRQAPRNRWCVTFNNPPTSFIQSFSDGSLDSVVLPHFKCFMGQLEEGGNSGTPHLQLSVWTIKKVRFSGIKRLLDGVGMLGCHIEPMNGTWKQSTTYCSKDDPTYRAGPWTIGAAPAMGKAALMDTLVTAVQANDDIFDIIREYPSLAAHRKAYDWLQELRMKEMGNRWRDMTVSVFLGPPGTGKTRTAVEEAGGYPNVYILTKLNKGMTWWDGYAGEDTVVIDDFDSEWTIPFRALLRILDGHPTRLPVKGCFRYALFTKVVVTTNVPIGCWYPDQDLAPLERRISATRHFPDPVVSESEFSHRSRNVEIAGGSGSRTGGNTNPQSRTENFSSENVAPLSRANAFIDLTTPEVLSSDSFVVHDTSSSAEASRWITELSSTESEDEEEGAPSQRLNVQRELFTVVADSDSGGDEGPVQLQRRRIRPDCPVELSGGAPEEQQEL